MSTIIVACHTLEDELNLAIRSTGVTYPVYWIDSKLHTKPEKLKEQVQAAISRISNVSTILLTFGYCGNALVGVKSESARLILPRVQDCISLLLGSEEKRGRLSKETPSYFLTRGWIESENNLADEYDYCVRRFGPERGLRLMRTILKHYRHLSLNHNAAYEITRYQAKTEALAASLGLGHQMVKGSQTLFHKLLTGPWDGDFVIAEPGQEITLDGLLELYRQGQSGQL